MKFLLLASFALFCTASTVFKNKNITVGDDGSILITSPYGRRVSIQKQLGLDGQRGIEISVAGPNIPTKTIQVGDYYLGEQLSPGPWSSVDSLNEELRSKRGSTKSKSQSDVLSEIVKEYQGVVDEAQYEKLLAKINKAVKKGEVSPQIYDLLENLDQQTGEQEYPLGEQYSQGQVQRLSGLGLPYGSQYSSGVAETLPLSNLRLPQSQYQQYIQLPYYYDQYSGTPRSVNPLLWRTLGNSQNSYMGDLLANQQLSGGVPTRVGDQLVYGPQRYLSRPLGQYQLGLYGQGQRVLVPQGVGQQIIGQYRIPQPIEQLGPVQQELQQPVRSVPSYLRQSTRIPQIVGQSEGVYPSQSLPRDYLMYRQPLGYQVPQVQLVY